MATESNELPAVRQHFNESVEALGKINELLEGLRDSATSSSTSAAALHETAAALSTASVELSKVTEQIAAAVETTEEALGASRNFLEQTDLTQIASQLTEITEAAVTNTVAITEKVDQFGSAQAATHASLAESVDAIKNELIERAQASESRASKAEAELATLKKMLPARTLKRLEGN